MEKRRRAKPKTDWDGSYREDPSFQLSEETRGELVEIFDLEHDPESAAEMLASVQRQLSMYPSMVKALDSAPRPAHLQAAIEPIRQQVEKLFTRLDSSIGEPWWFDLMVESGFDFDGDRRELLDRIETFAKGLARLSERYAGEKSRHAPPLAARKHLITKLKILFQRYFEPEPGADEKQRAALVDFLKVALEVVGAPVPALTSARHMSQSRLWRLSV